VGSSQFELSADVPDGRLIDMLVQRTKVHPQPSAYVSSGLATVLLFLAAIQAFLILGRSEPDRAGASGSSSFVERAERRRMEFVATPPPQPTPAQRGRVRSFFGEIYSLMFESRR
jgi:hypothetical protein